MAEKGKPPSQGTKTQDGNRRTHGGSNFEKTPISPTPVSIDESMDGSSAAKRKPSNQSVRKSVIVTRQELEKLPQHKIIHSVRIEEEERSCYDMFPRTFPRLYAICFYIILPLWFLIFLSVGGGYWLASFEAPNEIKANDDILRGQFLQEDLDGSGSQALDYLLNLPTFCFEKYLREQAILDTNYTLFNVVALTNQDVSQTGLLRATSETLNEILLRLALCATDAEIAAERVEILRKAIEDESVYGDLTFDWIRCWNQTELGVNTPLRPTEEHLQAAANQSEFYTEMWETDRARLTEEYLEDLDNVTAGDIIAARLYGIDNASGGDFCKANSAGTSWFWFTVMTTVGYGNQAPVTGAGRAMVSTLGFMSMLAFGGILLNAGQVVSVLMDDVLTRNRLKISPWHAIVFWTAATTGWIFAIGNITRRWWDDRLEDFEYDFWDSVWFAYISTTTVGLGDFFLQPEVIFLPDVATFSLLFLTGFVFLSTCLDKVTELVGSLFPDVSEDLKSWVDKTALFRTDIVDIVSEDYTVVEALRHLVEEKSQEGIKDLTILREENDLLRKLLEKNADELNELLEQNAHDRKGLVEESERITDHIALAGSSIRTPGS